MTEEKSHKEGKVEDFMSFRRLQYEQSQWSDANFGKNTNDSSQSDGAMLKIGEEVGELFYNYNKYKKNPKDKGKYDQIVDAIGDIIISLAGFCHRSNISLEDAVTETWKRVSKRDWVEYPLNGGKHLED